MVQIRSIAVVLSEAIKLDGYKTLNDIFTRKFLQLFKYLRQVALNSLLIYLNIVYALYQSHQLLLTHIESGWNLCLCKLALDNLLDLANLMQLFAVNDCDTHTRLAGARCAAAAVSVTLNFIRQVVIDNVRYIVHINSSSRYVSCNKHLK